MNAWTERAHGGHSKRARNLRHHLNQTQCVYEGDRRADKTIGDHTRETRRQQMKYGQSIEQDAQTKAS